MNGEEKTYVDQVFGEMKYKHRWEKKGTVTLFGMTWDIVIAAKAYRGKEITESQRDSYKRYKDAEGTLLEKAEEALTEYVRNTEHEAESREALKNHLHPKTLLFKQNGDIILLLDCAWEPDQGLAVSLYPEILVAIQDMFL